MEPIFLQGNSDFYNTLFPLLMIGIVIFLFYSQFKRQRDSRKFAENLEKGKEVVTGSGILGKITKIEGDIVTLEVSSKTYIRVTKNAINQELTDAIFPPKDKSQG